MTDNKEKIISRINRLFSLADSSRNPSEEEVFEALSKAKTLMAEYEISEADLITAGEKSDSRWTFKEERFVVETATVPMWHSQLLFGISKLTHTHVTQGGYRGERYFRIRGESVDVGIAIALFEILKKQARRLAEEKFKTRTDRRSYCEGFSGGVQQQAREAVKSLSADSANRYALVSTEKTTWLAKQGVILDNGVSTKRRTNPNAYNHGYRDGYATETSYRQKALV